MSAFRTSLIAFAAIAASSLYATSATATAQSAVALLYGGNEIDGATGKANAGDTNGYGIATVSVVSRDKICFTLFVIRIGAPTAAHIHVAPPGVNGGVVIPLTPVPGSGNPGTSSGCVAGDPKVIAKIRKKPDQFYVNVHNKRYPAGAIRGQLF